MGCFESHLSYCEQLISLILGLFSLGLLYKECIGVCCILDCGVHYVSYACI